MTAENHVPGPRYLGLSVAVAVTIVLLFGIDRLLANIEHAEIQREAQSQFENGMRLLRMRNSAGALTSLERASSLARTNRQYALGLIEALIANGERPEAESKLREILTVDSNDGRANLLLARLLSADARTDEAVAFYHRAIYGVWRDPDTERPKARLELAKYLAGVQRPQELLAELLLLQDRVGQGSAGNDMTLSENLAKLFLVAGSGSRAAEMYRTILKASPSDPDALRGLAEADLLSGDYRAAESMFLQALKRRPEDADLIHRLHFANTLAMLDPTSRRLGSQAKFERATTLLGNIDSGFSGCPAMAASPLLASAQQELAARPPVTTTNDLAEARLSLAEKLWTVGEKACSGNLAGDQATAVIMRKIRETQ